MLSIGLTKSQGHGTFHSRFMHAEIVYCWSRIYAIVSIKRIFAVSMRSFIPSCGSFETIAPLGSRARALISPNSLKISVLPFVFNSSHICLIVSNKSQIFFFESLLIHLLVFNSALISYILTPLRDVSSPSEVLVAATGIGPAHADSVLSKSLFEEEIIVRRLEALLVVMTFFKNLFCHGRLL